MNSVPSEHRRLLAIDPTSKGFGFAVLEGPAKLVDWGVKQARENRNLACLEQVRQLLGQFSPDVIVVEDVEVSGSRRCQRVRGLTAKIVALASKRRVASQRISRRRVLAYFARTDVLTKHRIATAIAKRFPELDPRLPPLRKPWMSEDERMSIFDAVALALTFFESGRKRALLNRSLLASPANAQQEEDQNPGE
jgi:ribosomal protein L17